MGVGDVLAVLVTRSRAWLSADTADSFREGHQSYARLVSGCGRAELDSLRQPCRHRISVSDVAWFEYRSCSIFRFSEDGSDGMRINRMGCRDICEMYVRRRISRDSSGIRNFGRAW